MNIIQLNTLHLNVVLQNGDEMPGEVVVGGGEVVPVPPTEPETPDVPDVPVEPKKFILSASVANGVVSATLNGVVVSLPYTANDGDTIVVSVTPNDGYAFEGWADGNTDNPRTITMASDVVLSAECIAVPSESKYIQFEDAEVERVLMSKGVSSDGVGITMEDAAKVTSIDKWFQNNTAITSFDEFEYFTGVTSLVGGWNSSAFFGCTNLRSIKFPPSITSLGNDCFMNCSSLAIDVDLPYLKSVGFGVFHGTAIRRIINLGNITTIGNAGSSQSHTFAGFCPYLTSVELPSTLTILGIKAFSNDTSLESIICRATTPPTMNATTALEDTNNCPIYVPDASLEAYKTATNWTNFASRIKPLSEIEGSPYIQFEDAEVERVLMANGVSSDGIGITKEDAANVTSIGTWFKENTTIQTFDELKYFTNVKATSVYAFLGCTALQWVNYENIESINSQVFNNSGITELILPKVITISNSGLVGMKKVTKVVIGASCTNIDANNIWSWDDKGKVSFIFEGATPPTFSTSNNKPDWYGVTFYVPDASVDAYKSAWSSWASRIKGISEYNG